MSLEDESRDRGWALFGRAEVVAAWGVVAWLQLVGVVTDSVLHHVIHALPVVLLAAWPRGPWARHTAVLAGLAWVVMLSLLSPMIRYVLQHGVHIGSPRVAFTWLAPGMVLLSAAWSSLSMGLITKRKWVTAAWFLGMLALAYGCAIAQPWIGGWLGVPVERVLEGAWWWTGLLLVEALLMLGGPWVLVRRLAAPPRVLLDRRMATVQVGYWIVFVGCMVIGLAV